MTYDQEQAIRRWLNSVGEIDHETIGDTLKDCRENADSLRYYLMRAAETEQIEKLKKPQRPPHRTYNPPFIENKASADVHKAEMDKIREQLPCRS